LLVILLVNGADGRVVAVGQAWTLSQPPRPGAGALWEPLDLGSASDIRVAAARFWPSTRWPYTPFVMSTLECPRTSETT
jgi:hypothetical protein